MAGTYRERKAARAARLRTRADGRDIEPVGDDRCDPQASRRTGTMTRNADVVPPLEDRSYAPIHQPTDGQPPAVIEKWGPRSQVRWFARFPGLRLKEAVWDRFYCESVEHRGLCCSSCDDDWQWQGYANFDDHCCCRGFRAPSGMEDADRG